MSETTPKDLSLVHNILDPQESSEKPPLLLMLHGYGSHENDLFELAPALNRKFFIVSARGLQNLPWGGFAWYNIDFENIGSGRMTDIQGARDAREKVKGFIGEIHAEYGTDPENTWIMGFSQGAILAHSLCLSYPRMFQKALCLSGYVLNELIPEKVNPLDYSHLDILMTHGKQDPVLPVEWARKTSELLEKIKVKHTYKEYNMPHGITPECFEDIRKWLLERDAI